METVGTVTALLDTEMRREVGIDIQTYDALLHAYEAGEAGIRMTDLAGAVVLSKSGLTTLVDRLEKRGLLERVPDPDDRRAVRITLTETGVETFRTAARVNIAVVRRLVGDHLSDEEAETIAAALERVRGEAITPGATSS